MLKKSIHIFENIIVVTLLVILGIIVAISTFELAATIIDMVLSHKGEKGYMFLEMNELLSLFSFVLLIVIGLELFETIKFYLNKHIIQADVIMLVALTAIARKVIVLDYAKTDQSLLIGIAAIIAALSAGYYFIKAGNRGEIKIKNEKK